MMPRLCSHGNWSPGSRVPGCFCLEPQPVGLQTSAGGDHCPAQPKGERENNLVVDSQQPKDVDR